MADLKGIEIFSAGVWNNDPYTIEDLDRIVEAFPVAGVTPPLKLGHTEAQKFFGQSDGAPALGWIERVYRRGAKLLADVSGVPEALKSMIQAKRYSKVSAEIYWNYKTGRAGVLPRVLKAVALLGADLPAVSNLQDLQAALMSEVGDVEVRCYELLAGGESFAEVTDRIMQERDCSYAEAQEAARVEYPDLFRAYLFGEE